MLLLRKNIFLEHTWLVVIVVVVPVGPLDLLLDRRMFRCPMFYICRAMTRPPRPSSTAECLRLIARLRGEQASAASWEPRPPFEATEMD